MTCLPERLSKPLFHYEQHLRDKVRPQTRIAYGNTNWRFLKLFEDRRSLAEFRPADLCRYRAMRRGEGLASQTIQAEIEMVCRFFAWTAENNADVAVHPDWRRRKPVRCQRPAKPALAVAA